MFAKMLPLIFLALGTGGGIGAGIFLAPKPTLQPDGDNHKTEVAEAQPEEVVSRSKTEFVRMSNQFVIPLVKKDTVAALVVVSLSLETRSGASEGIYSREPKLRDAFLRVLFDHANMGGFQGAFTRAETMELLRTALREVAQKELGPDILDVLIVDIVRQDT